MAKKVIECDQCHNLVDVEKEETYTSFDGIDYCRDCWFKVSMDCIEQKLAQAKVCRDIHQRTVDELERRLSSLARGEDAYLEQG